MKKETIICLIVLILVSACTAEEKIVEEKQSGLPNPASQFCVEKGYELEIRTKPDGSQTGYCIFPDGSECEEWAYYRGECQHKLGK